ncbi:leukemia inhibitory factor receptor [Ambystoma mexicanum]|uniref:leukemia inhibitory factor receptor n=1 Tax=Ambystoma mexicanum TaxID=8296 RepID=UPI0037E8BA0B
MLAVRMSVKLYLGPVPALLLGLLSHVLCQERGFPEAPETFKCITHNLQTWVCSWNSSSNAVPNITYEVCYRSSSPLKCTTTQETRLEFDALSFATTEVKIIAKNEKGTAETTFRLTESDVPFIPYEPQILHVVAYHEESALNVEWKGNSSSFFEAGEVRWEIQFLRTDNMEVATTVVYSTIWTETEEVFHYNWTSDFPLKCTSHSVRIRCYVNDKYYSGGKGWSNWSTVKTIPGSTEPSVLPDEKVVPAGSNMTFCCIVEKGEKVSSLSYGSTYYPLIPLGDYSSAIKVYNMDVSRSSGANIVCNKYQGAVIFVGYPPDVPQHLTCETHLFDVVTCSWNVGRQTGLYSERRETKYFLYEGFSGKTIKCGAPPVDSERFQCDFQIIEKENHYNFTLSASNPLGSSQSALLIDVRRRVHPKAPRNLVVSNTSPRSINLSWSLPGNFTSLKLNCQIETSNKKEQTELRNSTLSGQHGTLYRASVDNLHPFSTYRFRVRCAALEHFWKWSEWSSEKMHTTKEAPPQRKPDVWREIVWNPEGRMLLLYWKPLSENDANGVILNYEVMWTALNANALPESRRVLSVQNKTEIQLDNNDYIISFVANNSAGVSPSANLSTMEFTNGNLETEYVVGTGDGINITWHHGSNATCGITIQWRPSSSFVSSALDWETFPSDQTDAWIPASLLQTGVRYTFSVYGCKDYEYQLLKNIIGYMEELWPASAPNFTVKETTSSSVQIKWDDMPVEALRGFLRGYLIYISKDGNSSSALSFEEQGRSDMKVKNITDTKTKILTIRDLKSGTRYVLGLQAYTGGGKSPLRSLYVDTPDNLVGLILAIFIPIAVALLLGVMTSTICYRKREWLKETFYPDIPNPQNSKALQFENSVSEGNPALKTLEMNPCTPNNVEVVETLSTVPKIVDTELISPIGGSEELGDHLIDEDSDTETENHIVVSYCPPIIEEEISNPALGDCAEASQIIYLDIQSMYQPQTKANEEADIDLEDMAGYKPQMQLPITTVNLGGQLPAEDVSDQTAGYKPQANVNNWNADSPSSPTSAASYGENASFGSPCSINSRHFLIPPEDEKDLLKPTHAGWSFSSLFQNKTDE